MHPELRDELVMLARHRGATRARAADRIEPSAVRARRALRGSR
jgi:hypothetical protein